jgi:hypothetical protein
MKDFMPINLSSGTLSGMKGDLTQALQDCLKKMEDAKSDTGKVTLSITITKDKIPVTTEKDYRDATVPRFKWKAESNVPLKEAFEGDFGGDYELTSEDGSYGLKSINGQTSMFDVDEDDEDEEDEDE